MFHLSERLSSRAAGPRGARTYLKRAGLFGAGLVLLWIAIQLTPTGRDEADVYSDDAGTVAASPPAPKRTVPGIVTPGNMVAGLLLAGGIGFAIYLRRRSKSKPGSVPITTLGEVPVGQNQSLRLVECGEEILLLGITSGQINLIRSYPPDRFQTLREKRAAAIEEAGPAENGTHGSHFSEVLRQYAGRYADPQQNGTPW